MDSLGSPSSANLPNNHYRNDTQVIYYFINFITINYYYLFLLLLLTIMIKFNKKFIYIYVFDYNWIIKR